MGKKIDRFVLTSVFAAGLYFYFQSAFQNHVLALILALFCCATVIKTLHHIQKWFENTTWKQKRNLRRRSRSALMKFVCMEETAALEHIRRLLMAGYGWSEAIHLELLHPSMQLSHESIFNTWRTHRNTERIVICTTAKCASDAKTFASSLKSPRVALVDGEILSQLIAEHPEECFFDEPGRKRHTLHLRQMLQLILNRRNAPRCLLFAFSMLIMYVFSANIYYLVASLLLLFVALISLHRVSRPAKLF